MAHGPQGSDRIAYILLTLTAAFFGGGAVAGKLSVQAIPPLTVAGARFAVASALLWLWARAQAHTGHRPTRHDLPLIVGMGLTGVAAYNILFLYGLTLSPASDSAIIVPGLVPVLTVALAWPVLGERVTRRGVAGLVVAFAGVLLVISPGGGSSPSRLLGDVLFLFGAACWAAYSVIGKAATARFDPVSATLYGTISGTLLLLPFAFAEQGWTKLVGAPTTAWIGVLYLAVFSTVLAFVFFYQGVKRIGAARATSFGFLVPIFGVISSILILGERVSLLSMGGGRVHSARAMARAAPNRVDQVGFREAGFVERMEEVVATSNSFGPAAAGRRRSRRPTAGGRSTRGACPERSRGARSGHSTRRPPAMPAGRTQSKALPFSHADRRGRRPFD